MVYTSRRHWLVYSCLSYFFFFFFKQKTAYELRISDWSSDVCSSDLDGSSTGAADPASPRSAAGNGRPSGARRFLASDTSTKPPLAPGTAPLTRISPASASDEITSRLCTVLRDRKSVG